MGLIIFYDRVGRGAVWLVSGVGAVFYMNDFALLATSRAVLAKILILVVDHGAKLP